MNIELPLRVFQAQVDIMERVIRLLVSSITQPTMRRINSDRGYRFDEPTIHHFCLLKAVRVVSALNASIELARRGYTQEIAVLMRTVAEFTTHIEFVLGMDILAEHQLKVKNYIEAFFADSRRDPEAELKKAQIPQGIVHTSIGKTLDKLMSEQAGSVEGRTPAASLYSNVYRILFKLCPWEVSRDYGSLWRNAWTVSPSRYEWNAKGQRDRGSAWVFCYERFQYIYQNSAVPKPARSYRSRPGTKCLVHRGGER